MKLLKTPWIDELIAYVHSSKDEIFICSPFVEEEVVQKVLDSKCCDKVRFLTSADPCNKEALIALYDEDVEVKLLRKPCPVDGDECDNMN